ncbi:MAG: hypothetical protein AABX88_01170 [Nanoarchaeota archaeon]
MEPKDKKLIKKHKKIIYGELEKFIEKDNPKLKINFDEREDINNFIVRNRHKSIDFEIDKPNKTITLYTQDDLNNKANIQSTYDIYK